MAHEVFISYSSQDKVIADAVCAGLEAEGIRCWISSRDIPHGTKFVHEISTAIINCKVLVVIHSKSVSTADWVMREVERAINNKKHIIPFGIDQSKPELGLDLILGSLNWLDAMTEPLSQHIAKLSRSILALLGPEEAEKAIERKRLLTSHADDDRKPDPDRSQIENGIEQNSTNIKDLVEGQGQELPSTKGISAIISDPIDPENSLPPVAPGSILKRKIPVLTLAGAIILTMAFAGYFVTSSHDRKGFVERKSAHELYDQGFAIYINKNNPQHFEKSFPILKQAADLGDPKAQGLVGWIYFNGEGMPATNEREAAKWYELSANQAHAPAQYFLGWMYEDGRGVKQDPDKALELYRRAKANKDLKESGYEESTDQGLARLEKKYPSDRVKQFELGQKYLNADGVDKDVDLAYKWFQKSADQGYVLAEYEMGYMYHTHTPPDYDKAIVYFRKSAAQNNLAAWYMLGVMYTDGHGADRSYEEAVKWHRLAAASNYPFSQFYLGQLYEKGLGIDKVDIEGARELYRKVVAELSPEDGLAKQAKDALAHLDEDYPTDSIKQNELGQKYFDGNGRPKNVPLAVEWFRKSAEKGNVLSQVSLGWILQNGPDIKVDEPESAKWYAAAANQGLPQAQFQLAFDYEFGKGVIQNRKTAREWYEKALAAESANDQIKQLCSDGLKRLDKPVTNAVEPTVPVAAPMSP